jgi:hypothetical protein
MVQPGNDLPVLIGQAGPLNSLRWQVETHLIIGRDATCDVVIVDRQISRYHAQLENTHEGVILEDLGSKNGTFVNGQRIEDPVLLKDGDLIQVALVQHFAFMISDSTMALDTAVIPSAKPRGRIYMETRSRRVWVGGKEIVPPLSLQQFRLLQFLEARRGQVVARQELIDEVWGEDEAIGVSEQAFDALVRRLRERLEGLDPDNNFIITVRGHGLRLDNPEE